MRRRFQLASALLILLAVVAQAGVVSAGSVGEAYLVVFNEGNVTQSEENVSSTFPPLPAQAGAAGLAKVDRQKVNARLADLQARLGFKAKHVFHSAVGGFAANLSQVQADRLRSDPAVAFVTPDEKVSLDDGLAGEEVNIAGIKITTSNTPRLPAGIQRVGATRNAIADIDGRDNRVDADIAVLDTGVDGAHPDLNVVGGYNCTTTNRGAWGDEHGHGTHVAGTAAALDDGVGVVGVAPGARIWSVKVLNKQGTGYLSWLVCGIDWVTGLKDSGAASGQRIEVANMSLRFTFNGDTRECGVPARDAVHQAICRSTRAGVLYAVAAGNDERNARYYRPAAYPSALAVSAIVDYDGKPGGLARQADYCSFYSADADDTFADFSNYGAVVDLTAPGKCVVSTYPGKRYAWMSGTSMATPHVAGGAAIYRVRYPTAQPQQVRMALENMGTLDWRTGTDPDGRHEPARWLGAYSPPPEFDMSANPPTGWVGHGSRVPVRISRTNGHTASISLSLRDAPAGLSGSGSVSRSSGSLTLYVQPGTATGWHQVTLRATDGELVRTRKIDLRIDGTPPAAGFQSPEAGFSIQTSNNVLVSWNESDQGSGVADRVLQRQRASISSTGTCDSVTWSDVGSAETRKDDYVQSLMAGYCFRWLLSVRDNAGNTTRLTSGSVLIVDPDSANLGAPTVTSPQANVLRNSKVSLSGLARLELTWSGGSTAAVFELRYSADGGSSWTNVALPAPGTPRAVVLLPAGSYVFASRAGDGKGNWSSWSQSAQRTLSLSQAESGAVSYSGNWNTASISKTLGGKVRYSAQKDASAKFTFSGRQVSVVGLTASNRGKADVYINGNRVATIDLRSSSTIKRKIVFSRSWAKVRTRTVEVRLHGGARVDLDAFIVLK